jgi:hypothetical protein
MQSLAHPTRLRQVALVTRDLVKARELLTYIFDIPVIFADPAVGIWGLENFLLSLGGDIIEVVAPVRDNTTAGRLLQRRGEGGYMIIMQTGDAVARREDAEAKEDRKVIFSHEFKYKYETWGGENDKGWCIQYHPKGLKGGMMPELDSHNVSPRNKAPVSDRFSPWHACGEEYERYVKVMRQTQHLHLISCVLRLGPGDHDTAGAADQWARSFGIPKAGEKLAFTNAQMSFHPGSAAHKEGLLSLSIGVANKAVREGILGRAKEQVVSGDGWFEALGVKWYIMDTEARSQL